jgi:hypothetical protein
VFDRYTDFSTKYSTQKARGPGGCRVFQLSANSPLPPQKQVLNVSENKRQLIQIIIKTLVQPQWEHQGTLIVTGQGDAPMLLYAVVTNTTSMAKGWTAETRRTTANKLPKLCSLPPTTEAFEVNVK